MFSLSLEVLVSSSVFLLTSVIFVFIVVQTLTNILKERLVNEGRRPYIIPVGGSNSLGTW